jgi:hypothetical protein
MTQQMLIKELAITPTTLESILRQAVVRWNMNHENKASYHEFLVNILTYWTSKRARPLLSCLMITPGSRGRTINGSGPRVTLGQTNDPPPLGDENEVDT